MSQPLAVGNAPFATRSTVLLLCLAAASMVTAFLLLVFRSDQLTRSTVDANAYSVSALGHRALVALLQATHRPVVISRFTKGTLTQRAMVICAEPLTDESERAVALAKDAAVFLLVLPKRHGLEGGDQPGWIDEATLLATERVDRLVTPFLPAGGVVRRPSPTSWRQRDVDLPTPQIEDLQLLRPVSGLRPLLECDGGVLLGRVAGRGNCYLLADPDVLENHGLDDGDNAAFVLAMLDQLREERNLVLDETAHGFELVPDIWMQLGTFPLVLLPVQLALLLAMVLWAAAGRFGPLVAVPPAIAPGKAFLVEQIAELMQVGGSSWQVLSRYCKDRVRSAASSMVGSPRDEKHAMLVVEARARARGRKDTLTSLHDEVQQAIASRRSPDPQRLLELAAKIHRECEEIVHGR